MSVDSIDVIDSIKIDVWYKEGVQSTSEEPNTPEEITAIECEGLCVSDLIGTLFTDDELLNAQTDIETNGSLQSIKSFVND